MSNNVLSTNPSKAESKFESILMTFILVVAFPAILIGVFAFLNYLPKLIAPETYESSMEWPLGGCVQQQPQRVTRD